MPEEAWDELDSLNNRGKTFCSDKGKICVFILFKDESHGIILQHISPELHHDTHPISDLLELVLNRQSLYQHCCMLIVCQIHKCVLQLVPACLFSRFEFNGNFGYSTWGESKIHLICPRLSLPETPYSSRVPSCTTIFLLLYVTSGACLPLSVVVLCIFVINVAIAMIFLVCT